MPGAGRPFEPGHQLAVQHGAKSAKIVEKRAEPFDAVLAETLPHLQRPEFVFIRGLTASSLAQLALIDAHFDRLGGIVDSKGRLRKAAEFWIKLHRQINAELAACGATPGSLANVQAALAGANRDRVIAEAQQRIASKYGQAPEPEAKVIVGATDSTDIDVITS